MTEKTMTLKEIKDKVAYDNNWRFWDDAPGEKQKEFWPIVCERYARECCKASLEKASENAKIEVDQLEYFVDTEIVHINKPSITDPSNVVIL